MFGEIHFGRPQVTPTLTPSPGPKSRIWLKQNKKPRDNPKDARNIKIQTGKSQMG